MDTESLAGPAVVRVDNDIVALGIRRKEPIYAVRGQALLAHDLVEQASGVGEQLGRLGTRHAVGQNGGPISFPPPPPGKPGTLDNGADPPPAGHPAARGSPKQA